MDSKNKDLIKYCKNKLLSRLKALAVSGKAQELDKAGFQVLKEYKGKGDQYSAEWSHKFYYLLLEMLQLWGKDKDYSMGSNQTPNGYAKTYLELKKQIQFPSKSSPKYLNYPKNDLVRLEEIINEILLKRHSFVRLVMNLQDGDSPGTIIRLPLRVTPERQGLL